MTTAIVGAEPPTAPTWPSGGRPQHLPRVWCLVSSSPLCPWARVRAQKTGLRVVCQEA